MPAYLKLSGPCLDHVERAYHDGYYLEAIQVLHAYLENQLRQLLMAYGSTKRNLRYDETWDLTYELSFLIAAKVLFVVRKISKQEFAALATFNRTRKQVIHKLYFDPYKKSYNGVLKSEYAKVFALGKRLHGKFEERLDVAFGVTKKTRAPE